ncbi:MAG: ABC transporter permease [Dehalococcoidia bacterium]|nr:ABC transporter permease [Dehalococcoidia bacterium]
MTSPRLALAGRLGRWKEAAPDLRSPGAAAFYASAAIALVFIFLALWPQSVAFFDPTVNDLPLRHVPPGHVDEDGGFHLLGTDHLGRDVWSRLVWGARASLMVGASGLVLGGIVGISLGLLAGYRGGWTDRIAMRIVDAFLSFPYILIAIVWAALIGTDLKSLILIVAVRGWVEFCRVVRGQALSLRERDYVSAARAVGATDWRIVLRHILPNTIAPILVVAGYELGRLVLLEATLSFLTIGIRPPTPAWGSMLSDARNYLNQAWWTVTFPGMAISLIVMSANFMGDSLRDRLDPMLRGRTQ